MLFMPKLKKRDIAKDKKNRASERNDKLAVAVFFAASYLSLNYLENSVWYDFSGILFLICALFGVLSLYKGKKFIFGK